MYTYKGRVIKVVDGDTLDVEIDLGFDIKHNIRVRLLNVHAPEIHSVKRGSEEYIRGMEAKEKVDQWVASNPEVRILTVKDKKEKFGRYLAEVWDISHTSCLNHL
jgi:micrococcal nuclease